MFALLRALSLDEVLAPPPPEKARPPKTTSDNHHAHKTSPNAHLPIDSVASENLSAPLLPAPSPKTVKKSKPQARGSALSRVSAQVPAPLFNRGDLVVQAKASGQVRQGEIVAIHTDDLANGIYYTVLSDGREFQADEKRLTPHTAFEEYECAITDREPPPRQQRQQQQQQHTATTIVEVPGSRVTNVANTQTEAKTVIMKQMLENRELAARVVEQNETFVFDCDGVLWHGDEIIPGASELLLQLCDLNKRVVFVTNNSARHRSSLREKLLNLGVPASTLDADGAVINSGWACARHITLQLPHVRRVFVVGMKGLRREFEEAGFQVVADDPIPGSSDAGGDEIFEDVLCRVGDGRGSGTDDRYQHIDAVVVGLDSTVDYRKLCVASVLIQTGSEFLCTNADAFMMQGGHRRPGNGAIMASLCTTTGIEPTVTGKPSLALAGVIASLPGVKTETTCMVGDRLDTDILFGRQAGWNCLLVLSGCSTPAMIDSLEDNAPHCPHFIAQSVAALLLVRPAVENNAANENDNEAPSRLHVGVTEEARNADVGPEDINTDPAEDREVAIGAVVRAAALAIERNVAGEHDGIVCVDEDDLWVARMDDHKTA
jgi:phosphoglycolate/pyridoxal phosphate phosphatase family enzyme